NPSAIDAALADTAKSITDSLLQPTTLDAKRDSERRNARFRRELLEIRTAATRLEPKARESQAREVAANNRHEIQSFVEGIRNGWILTRNSGVDGRRIFVHTESSGRELRGLRYLVKESSDGRTWTVYEADE